MSRFKRYPRAVTTAVCLMIAAAATGLYALRHFNFSSLAESFPGGELVVAIDPGYPPFGSIVNDQFTGLDVDLGRALAETLGLTPRFVMVNFDSAYDAVKTGAADISLAALRVDYGRADNVSYTWGYLNDGVMLVSQTGLGSGWNLGGARVGVELGAAGHAEARKWQRRVKAMEIVAYDTPDEALAALTAAHAVDAVMADAISVRGYLRAHPGLKLEAAYLTSDYYAGAVRTDRRGVLYHLNGAMLTLLNDGTLERLLARHLGGEPSPVRP